MLYAVDVIHSIEEDEMKFVAGNINQFDSIKAFLMSPKKCLYTFDFAIMILDSLSFEHTHTNVSSIFSFSLSHSHFANSILSSESYEERIKMFEWKQSAITQFEFLIVL